MFKFFKAIFNATCDILSPHSVPTRNKGLLVQNVVWHNRVSEYLSLR